MLVTIKKGIQGSSKTLQFFRKKTFIRRGRELFYNIALQHSGMYFQLYLPIATSI